MDTDVESANTAENNIKKVTIDQHQILEYSKVRIKSQVHGLICNYSFDWSDEYGISWSIQSECRLQILSCVGLLCRQQGVGSKL